LNKLLREAGMVEIKEMIEKAGSKIWKEAADRISRYSYFLGFALRAMWDLIEKCERGEGGMACSIAGNWYA